jgi:hypothetical protein
VGLVVLGCGNCNYSRVSAFIWRFKRKKLIDTGLYGFSRIWKILLDGKLGHWTVWERNATNQLSNSNVHLTKSLKQSSIAQFQLYGIYLIDRKIAILKGASSHIINNYHNLNA